MKVEVGMYVRIKNKVGYCAIGKIENINDYREPMMKYCIDIQGNDFIFVPKEMIIKASHNIIDLIEVGDYVNGYRVDFVENIDSPIITIKKVFCEEYTKDLYSKTFNIKDIKSIVTKEQFESISYKVGEE